MRMVLHMAGLAQYNAFRRFRQYPFPCPVPYPVSILLCRIEMMELKEHPGAAILTAFIRHVAIALRCSTLLAIVTIPILVGHSCPTSLEKKEEGRPPDASPDWCLPPSHPERPLQEGCESFAVGR